jgi:transcriptional regulator with XRE-family HTH domain
MAQKKPALATHITKDARHKLVRLCLTSIRYEYVDMPLTRKTRRGRPPSPENRLANRLNVSTRTVRRWASGQDAIQSSDANAEKLAELAHTYNPEETTRILRVDAERYRRKVEAWLGYMESNSVTCPCPEKQEDENPRPHQRAR